MGLYHFRNRAADHIKRQQRERKITHEMRTQIDISQNTTSSETNTKNTIDHLRDLIRMLSPTDQEVLFAFYIEGMSIKEISRCFHLAQGTVKSRLYTARSHLKSAHEATKGTCNE